MEKVRLNAVVELDWIKSADPELVPCVENDHIPGILALHKALEEQEWSEARVILDAHFGTPKLAIEPSVIVLLHQYQPQVAFHYSDTIQWCYEKVA